MQKTMGWSFAKMTPREVVRVVFVKRPGEVFCGNTEGDPNGQDEILGGLKRLGSNRGEVLNGQIQPSALCSCTGEFKWLGPLVIGSEPYT